LRPEASAYDHLAEVARDLPPEAVRARLGSFGFKEDQAFAPVAMLSGGERARLNLALVTSDAPALLVLDEPTNHLDLETREELVRSLNEFAGAVVLVTHDWHLMELIADRLWLVADGSVRPFDGDLEDYRRLLLTCAAAPQGRRLQPVERGREARRRGVAQRRLIDPLRLAARHAEEAVARLTAERNTLDRAIALPIGRQPGGPAIAAALTRRSELELAIERAEAEWLAAQEALDRALRLTG